MEQYEMIDLVLKLVALLVQCLGVTVTALGAYIAYKGMTK